MAIHPAVFSLPLETFLRQVGTVEEGSLLEASVVTRPAVMVAELVLGTT